MKKILLLLLLILTACTTQYRGEYELVCSIRHKEDISKIDEDLDKDTYFIEWQEDSTYQAFDNEITEAHSEQTLLLNYPSTQDYVEERPVTDFTQTLDLYFEAIFKDAQATKTDPDTIVEKHVSSALIEVEHKVEDEKLTDVLKSIEDLEENCVLTKLSD